MSAFRTNKQVARPGCGLPGEEYAALKGQHIVGQVYKCPEQVYHRHAQGLCGHSTEGDYNAQRRVTHRRSYNKPDSANKDRVQPLINHTDSELQKANVAKATRKAIGTGFYPAEYPDDNQGKYGGPQESSDWYYRNEIKWSITEKYSKEFHQKWYEDDEDHDAEQLLADMTANARWRKHAPIHPMYSPSGDFRGPTQSSDETKNRSWNEASERAPLVRSMTAGLKPFVRPELQSKFSWSTVSPSIKEEQQHLSPRARLRKGIRNSLGRVRHKE